MKDKELRERVEYLENHISDMDNTIYDLIFDIYNLCEFLDIVKERIPQKVVFKKKSKEE